MHISYLSTSCSTTYAPPMKRDNCLTYRVSHHDDVWEGDAGHRMEEVVDEVIGEAHRVTWPGQNREKGGFFAIFTHFELSVTLTLSWSTWHILAPYDFNILSVVRPHLFYSLDQPWLNTKRVSFPVLSFLGVVAFSPNEPPFHCYSELWLVELQWNRVFRTSLKLGLR